MKVILVRHGRTSWNEEGRLQGWKGESLSEKGLAEVEALARKLSGLNPEIIYSSDLARAIQTAEIIIKANSWDASHMTDPRLREINHGLWEGRKVSEMPELKNLETVEGFRPPGGESFRDVAARVGEFIADLKKSEHGNVLVIGHQVSNAAFTLLSMGFTPDHRVFDFLSAGMVSSLALMANTGRNLISLIQANTEWETLNL